MNRDTYNTKNRQLRERADELKLKIEGCDRGVDENADLAVKTFELSQALVEKWDSADIAEKRQILEIVCLNWTLEGASLVPTMRKPFDILAEGLLTKNGRGGRI